MRRRAVTLIEIVMALTICTAAIVAVQWAGTGSVVQTQLAAGQARELVAALRAARETAVGSGQRVRVRFLSLPELGSAGRTTGFVVEQSEDNSTYVPVASITRFPTRLVGQSNLSAITFEPTGETDNALRHTFSAGGQSFVVTVDRLGGRAHYVKQ